MVVTKGSKINSKIAAPYYFCVTNRYASLPAFSALPDPLSSPALALDPTPLKHQSHYWLKVMCCRKSKWIEQLKILHEDQCFDTQIARAGDERTGMAKANKDDPQHCAVDQAQQRRGCKPSLMQRSLNAGYSISTTFCKPIQRLKLNNQYVFDF